MPINDGDIKLLASQRMADTADAGGSVTGNVILDGVSNNIFPDISELDRTYGRVSLRKVFAAAQTDDTASYFGAHLILADAPDDPRVSTTLFTTGSWTDQRAAAVDRLESYLARGPKFQGYLYDQHITGQKALLLLMRTDRALPAIGATLCLVKNPALPTEQSQFVRITAVSAQALQFDASGCPQTFTRNVVTLTISDPLRFDLAGGQPHCQDDTAQTIASKVYTTVVADAAQYYGIRPLATAAATGDLTVRADSIYSSLVPSAQTEIPIVDARPNGDSTLLVAAGAGTVSVTSTTTFDPSHAWCFGQAILPGTLTITATGYSLTDKGGVLMSGTAQIGLVDYANGIVSLAAGGPTIPSPRSATFRPAAAPTRNTQTASWAVTPESRSGTIVALLDPIPAPASLVVSYMAQGRWYSIRDDGSGALRGEDVAYGSGVVNFTSGSLVVTLGALPDVGSAVLATYAVPVLEIDRSGGTLQAYQDITLPITDALVPGTVTIAWGSGQTATDDGNGNLAGAASGTVNYADRTLHFVPNTLPATAATLTLTASSSTRQISPSVAPTQGGGALTFTVGTTVRPKTLVISVPVAADKLYQDGSTQTFNKTINLRDNGTGGMLSGSAVVGAVNYVTGEVSIPDSYGGVPVVEKRFNREASGLTCWNRMNYTGQSDCVSDFRYTLINTQAGTAAGTWTGANLTVSYAEGGTPATLPEHAVTWTPLIDLTPGYAEEIVPGSVRVSFAGKTLLDRSGKLYLDINPLTGSGTECGTLDYQTGIADVTGAAIGGQANSAAVAALLTAIQGHPVDAVTFRSAAAPLRPGSLVLQFARASGGGTVTVTATTDGLITGTDVAGYIDYQTGVCKVLFGRWVAAAGNESQPWYSAAAVNNGQIFRPAHVLGETLRYAAVAYAYIPLDATLLGLNPVRLPSDGRVPIFAAGRVAVVYHPATVSGTYSTSQTVDLGRTRIARVRVLDAAGVVVDASRYSINLDTGILTWGSVAGLAQPLAIEHSIEDMGLISDAQINGQITLTRPLTHDFPLGSKVASALIVGDMFARYTSLFDQQSWANTWADAVSGSAAQSSYNDVQYPIVVTNRGTIQERWELVFTGTTAFNVIGESVGQIATGNTATDLAPINPSTGVPYFHLAALGWGGGWSAGNVLRFNTVAANFPVWIARTIQQGPATAQSDAFTLQIRGDTNT